jgi:hypothetical protein
MRLMISSMSIEVRCQIEYRRRARRGVGRGAVTRVDLPELLLEVNAWTGFAATLIPANAAQLVAHPALGCAWLPRSTGRMGYGGHRAERLGLAIDWKP